MMLLPYFKDVKADNVQQHFNRLINELNSIFTQIQQGSPGLLPPTLPQLRAGLADSTSVGYDPNNLVQSNLPEGIPYNATTAGWEGPFFIPGSSLYTFVQTTLSLTSAQMAAFYQTLSNYSESP